MSEQVRRRLGRIAPWWRRFKRNGHRRDRCDHCGHPFRWSRDARFASGNRSGKVLHGPCQALTVWRARADERLTIVGAMSELAGLTSRDVQTAMELRDDKAAATQAWRVFYDLKKRDGNDE